MTEREFQDERLLDALWRVERQRHWAELRFALAAGEHEDPAGLRVTPEALAALARNLALSPRPVGWVPPPHLIMPFRIV